MGRSYDRYDATYSPSIFQKYIAYHSEIYLTIHRVFWPLSVKVQCENALLSSKLGVKNKTGYFLVSSVS